LNTRHIRRAITLESAWIKFAALQFIYWFVMGIGNFHSVYLQQSGITASTLGMLNAATAACTIVVTPVWGMVSDRIRSIRTIFLVTLAIGSVLFAFIPSIVCMPSVTTPVLLMYLCAVFAFRNPSNSFFDSWLVGYSDRKGFAYGSIRCFGSLGFTIVGLLITGLISAHGTAWTYPVSSVLMIAVFALSLATDDVRAATPAARTAEKKPLINPLVLFKDYYFVTFLLFAFLYNIVTNCRGSFLPYLMEEIGVSTSRFGVINAYIALIEIPMLLAAKPLRHHMPLYILTTAGCLGFAISCTLMGLCAGSLVSLLAFETFTGIGSGLIIASAAYYAYTLSPGNLKATGQSIYIAATALASIVGNLIGGHLLDSLGARPFYVLIGILGLLAALLFAAALLLGPKIVKRPPPKD